MGEEATPKKQRGRGRLSSIELLPEEAEPDVIWAREQLRERELPQSAIWMEFNERLADKGIDPISKSAFNRYSIRKAILYRNLDEKRMIASEVCKSLGTDDSDEITILVAEMLKLAVFEHLEAGGVTEKGLRDLSAVLGNVVKARRTSGIDSVEREARRSAQVEEAFDKAEELVTEAGLSAERIAQLRRDFLGVREEKGE